VDASLATAETSNCEANNHPGAMVMQYQVATETASTHAVAWWVAA